MTGGLFTISLIVSGAMEMGLASYNILFIDSTQNMVRLYNGSTCSFIQPSSQQR
jgi:hypothetical protein